MKDLIIMALVVVAVAAVGYAIKENSFNGATRETIIVPPEDAYYVASGKVLDLSGQGLAKVPEYVFNRTEIEELNLSGNSLGGSLQSQIGNLKNLKVLNLSSNRFTGVPAEVGQLTNLKILNISNNLLTGLPNELGNLSKLILLDLSGNEYSEADLSGIRKNLPATTVIKTN
ncbi:MAG: leucine-rich repeat domain-containing protein [Candidatus Paceibacterota bacterium]|jgi:Leucine-rich repeat (LRR) protein